MTKKKGVKSASIGDAPPVVPLDAPPLREQALRYHHLQESDVLVVREIEPGVLRIITVDARKFTYPPKA